MSFETEPNPSNNLSNLEPWQNLDNLYERALTRFLERSGFDYRDYLDEDELAEYAAAEQAELEQVGYPERRNTVKGKVVIEVLGGVAYLMSQPEGVEVEIIDRDNENEEHEREVQ